VHALSGLVLDFAWQLQFIVFMKTATRQSIRVALEFRATVKSILNETETLGASRSKVRFCGSW